ncbi:MAG TPA: hypothetical protein VF188_15000 [Longimicrobiales bacterium]
MVDPADDRILRAKYLDWCSAKLADRFLELTPDQIYELAYPPPQSDRAEPDPGGRISSSAANIESPSEPSFPLQTPSSRFAAVAAEAGLRYGALVERVTEVLAQRLNLPSFEEWAEAYRAAPERYEEEFLGLWQQKPA